MYNPTDDTCNTASGIANLGNSFTFTRLNDGRIMASGGESPQVDLLSTTSIFDPVTDTWSLGPRLSESRGLHSATALPDGRVLLVGGIGLEPRNGERALIASSEFVSP